VSLIVQKYGGTSVGDVDRIRNVAKRVLKTQAQGHQVVVVVSAMSGETNRLVDMAEKFRRSRTAASTTNGLHRRAGDDCAFWLSAIRDFGGQARSFLGHQVRITTDSAFSKARIKSIDASVIHDDLAKGTWSSSPVSRASIRKATSRRWAAAVRIRRRWRWPRR
jgi:aspartate kinase